MQENLRPIELYEYYEHLVENYWSPLNAFVLRRIHSPQDTEDIVQEAFIRAYSALERYSLQQISTLHVRPWLFKITWNVYCNYVSRTKGLETLSFDTPSGNLLLDDLSDEPGEYPEEIFEREESRNELERLVNTLPEQYREVIYLYYFDDLTHQEIADLLRRPPGTIKTHVHRGLKLLRKALGVERKARSMGQ